MKGVACELMKCPFMCLSLQDLASHPTSPRHCHHHTRPHQGLPAASGWQGVRGPGRGGGARGEAPAQTVHSGKQRPPSRMVPPSPQSRLSPVSLPPLTAHERLLERVAQQGPISGAAEAEAGTRCPAGERAAHCAPRLRGAHWPGTRDLCPLL